jgi:cell division protease FtsH
MTTPSQPGQHADPEWAREFATAFQNFLSWAYEPVEHRNPVVTLLRDFLADAPEQSVVARQLSPFEHVNLQTALNAWAAEPGRTVTVQGVTVPPHYAEISLQQLLSGHGLPPIALSAPGYVDLPNGPGSTLGCLRLALLLVTDGAGRYALLVAGPSEHQPVLQVEVAGLPVPAAQALHAELDALRSRLNVYRGQLLEVGPGPRLSFLDLPGVARDDVVLPEPVLGRVERHAFGVAAHRAALLGVGQHLKRGVLMYGPPGTGKTHTVRYLVTHMAGYTRLLLSGRALHMIGEVADLARELEPAVVVLEDVDLVAEDRSFGPAGNPILFDLLDAMDGAAADADLLFLLTTNRADLLEPALAARPGRVDVAVEIGLPDADARHRLLALYGRGMPLQLTESDVADAVERTDGVTAAFLKELLRRAALEAVHDDAQLRAVRAEHLRRALGDLLDSAQGVTRTLLGVGADPDAPPPALPAPGPASFGWSAYGRPGPMRRMYRSR